MCKLFALRIVTWRNDCLRIIIVGNIKLYLLSKFLRQSLLIFIIKGFRTIVFIFIVKFISPKNSLWIVQQDTWRKGYRHWFPMLLRRHSAEGWRFNPDYRWVIIQEYLTLVTESKQATPVDSIKDVVWSFVKFPSSTNTWRRPEDISAEMLWK